MSVDFEAIARHERCDAASLRIALPLLEQGYLPPFLARYRRDELGGLSETALWSLLDAVRLEQRLGQRKEDLLGRWEKTTLQDPAIKAAIEEASNRCVLDRVARRLRGEATEATSPSQALAARLLAPREGDSGDAGALAAAEYSDQAESAVLGLEAALADRLASDPRLIQSGVRWLAKNARIQILEVADPHGGEDPPEDEPAGKKKTSHVAPKAAAEAAPVAEPAQPAPSSEAISPETTAAATETTAAATETPAAATETPAAATETP